MVGRCVAAGCSKTHKDGISLFGFPKDASLRKKWADQVRRTRDKWEPSQRSVLCSKHFEDWCFDPGSKLSEAMGLGKTKARLNADAIPTIFEKPSSLKRKIPAAKSPALKRRRSAYEKRERSRVRTSFLCMLVASVVI